MGILSSKSKTIQCKCLSNGHCCRHSCFGDKSSTKKQLLISLKKFKADYLVDIIMEYLPDSHLTDTNTGSDNINYKSYCHQMSSLYYIQKQIPCLQWILNTIKLNDGFQPCNSSGLLPLPIKIVVMASGGVGKSALCLRYVIGKFIEDYDPTIEDYYIKRHNLFNLNKREIIYNILDTAGKEVFTSHEDEWIRNAQIIFLLFAIDNINSFKDVEKYHKRVFHVKDSLNDKNYAEIIVATKCDLFDLNNNKHILNRQNAIQNALEWNIPYIETSSKDGGNVNFLFDQAIYEYWIQSTHH